MRGCSIFNIDTNVGGMVSWGLRGTNQSNYDKPTSEAGRLNLVINPHYVGAGVSTSVFMKFKEWFEKKLVVGSYPLMNNTHFDAKEWDYCINVSDEHYFNIELLINESGCKTYWFPMNECRKDIGVNSIYGAMIILYYAEQNNKRVYLHCHAGIHRSQLVRCCYYFLRTGQQLDNNWSSFINQLLADCIRGYLPPKAEMEDLLSHLGQKIKDIKFNLDLSNKLLIVSDFGGLLDDCKIHAVRNF